MNDKNMKAALCRPKFVFIRGVRRVCVRLRGTSKISHCRAFWNLSVFVQQPSWMFKDPYAIRIISDKIQSWRIRTKENLMQFYRSKVSLSLSFFDYFSHFSFFSNFSIHFFQSQTFLYRIFRFSSHFFVSHAYDIFVVHARLMQHALTSSSRAIH